MSRHLQVTFDAHDPGALSHFWREVLGYVHPGPPGVDLPEGADALAAWDDFLAQLGVPKEERGARSAVEDPDGHGPRLFFQRVPEGKTAKNRVHLDVRVAPGLWGDERMVVLEAECERLIALGATRVRRHEPAPPMENGFIVMADPEGNEFCLD
ncbi:VOC family protein [Streptomyces sp. Edi4]|uniref:VOC family protein n=1 Tax=Streptomyces sp. Edi4 TaxID=3162527 RepID=UPI003305A716